MALILDIGERIAMKSDAFQEIVRMLEPHKKGSQPITDETDIAADLNLDSLAVMNLLMDIEDKFDVSIPLNVVSEIRTVGDLARSIDKAKEGA